MSDRLPIVGHRVIHDLSRAVNDSEDDRVSLREARRLTGIAYEALQAAIADGRLAAVKARRGHQAGKLGTRSHWLVARADLEAFVDGLPRCLYPGCEKPAAAASGCCSGPHALGVKAAGRSRPPEVGEKVRAAMTGRVRGPNPPEWNEQIAAGVQNFYDGDRSEDKRAESSARMSRSWETGEGAAPAVVATMDGHTRSKHIGRWAGQKAGRVTGRERGYSELQAKGVLELKRKEPTLGYRRLAQASGLSVWQVRTILAEHGLSD